MQEYQTLEHPIVPNNLPQNVSLVITDDELIFRYDDTDMIKPIIQQPDNHWKWQLQSNITLAAKTVLKMSKGNRG